VQLFFHQCHKEIIASTEYAFNNYQCQFLSAFWLIDEDVIKWRQFFVSVSFKIGRRAQAIILSDTSTFTE
jgi:hypothetical protein